MTEDLMRVTSAAQFFIKNQVKPGNIVIDATCGNGHDTLFLSNLVGKNGKVYAIDIQKEAIGKTKALIKEETSGNVEFFLGNHDSLDKLIPEEDIGKISAVMYNLGFLPESDKKVRTEAQSTLKSVKEALKVLATPGIVTICCYPHEEGIKEKEELKRFLSTLTGEFNAYSFLRLNRTCPPELFIITRG